MAWFSVPKLKKGQVGTFILKKDKVSGTPKAMLKSTKVDAYTAMNVQDVLSKKKEDYIRKLMIE